ncbi:hypothetical protein NQ318_011894 [Aromia moschata]|uniref:HTH psq-type domain-containing protein n=1 Tax=Aromia moschata TaxID=1265417 RepID=A0AAV8Y9A2_9CUCU|nr:hypothetical protein NQ318_011894 [Aromia moschata]
MGWMVCLVDITESYVHLTVLVCFAIYKVVKNMPRSKLGVKRHAVNTDNLVSALKRCVSAEMSIREAARTYGVSKSTLIRHINVFKASGASIFKYSANNNAKQVFNNGEELILEKYLITASRYYYGLTKKEVRCLAYQYAVANNKKYTHFWNTQNAAGKEWIRQFLKRHTNLSLRKPEAISLARSTRFHPVETSHLKKVWNCDETGVTTVNVPPKIVGPKGIKQIGQITSGERGVNVTIIAAINAILTISHP